MITVVGSVNVDIISYAEKLPVPGETVIGYDFQTTVGGKGANQAAAAARLGAKTYFLGKMSGCDKLADILWDGFSWAGVDVSHVEVENDIISGVGVIMVGENSQNLITIVAGTNARVTKDYIDRKMQVISSSKVVLTEFGIPIQTAEYVTKTASDAGVTTIVNPAPALPMTDSFYRATDVLTPNESEAEILSGIKVFDQGSAKNASEFFHNKGVPNVIITMGSLGVFVSTNERQEFIAAIDCKPLDTTGAGDAFSGGLAYGLGKGDDIFSAARIANTVAGISVTRSGTMKSMPTREEIEDYANSRK